MKPLKRRKVKVRIFALINLMKGFIMKKIKKLACVLVAFLSVGFAANAASGVDKESKLNFWCEVFPLGCTVKPTGGNGDGDDLPPIRIPPTIQINDE